MPAEPVFDDDNPEWTDADFARAVRLPGVPLAEAARYMQELARTPGEQITLKIDQDVLDRFRADGPGWLTRINDTVRRALA